MKSKEIGYLVASLGIILLILLSFAKTQVDLQEAFLCDVVHKNPDIPVESCPAHQSATSWLFTFSFGVAFLTTGLGGYMIFLPQMQKEKKELKEVDLSELNEEEREVYRYIKENEGSVYQGDIVKNTDFSKVKVSRILDRLENKEIIERKRRGMTNLVVLK